VEHRRAGVAGPERVAGEGAQFYLDGKPAPTSYDAPSGTASTHVPQGRHRLAVH